MRADRSKVVNLFSKMPEISEDIFNPRKPPVKQRRKQPQNSKGTANANNRARMMEKLEEERYHEFNEKDWFQYYVMKAEEHGIKYLVRNYAKEYTILKSILNELDWTELKLMIDFLYDSDQDIHPKQTLGIWILSKGWINSVYQSSLLWKDGKYRPKSAPTHNREWIAEASTKTKPSNSGLRYGKPIRDKGDDEVAPKPKAPEGKKKKSRITLGRKK